MRGKKLYFVNWWIDALFVGALSILVFLYYRYFYGGYSQYQVSDVALALSGSLLWVVNNPHFAASSYRLYGISDHARRFPLTSYLIPVLILLAVVGSFASERFASLFIHVFLFWSAYHFSAQSLGFALIYARRAAIPVSRLERMALAAFVYGCLLYQYAETEGMAGAMLFHGVTFDLLQLPAWTRIVSGAFLYAGLVTLVVSFGARFVRFRVPWIVLLPLVTQYLWFVHGAKVFSFQAFVPFFHSLQYMLIAWSLEMHRRAENTTAKSPSRFFVGETARWGGLMLAGGAALFWALPRLVGAFGGDIAFATAIISAAVQVHHFLVDGVIWKLSTESARSPLFSDLSPILGVWRKRS